MSRSLSFPSRKTPRKVFVPSRKELGVEIGELIYERKLDIKTVIEYIENKYGIKISKSFVKELISFIWGIDVQKLHKLKPEDYEKLKKQITKSVTAM